ncbi:electron transport complex, RnfABCDGE type, B subunit [SAR86 cluster bacterium SAR86E]|uniref:Electron transport complex, RnfABCDGE type, B subunit n=1 Tax=SAR86 cluster bacterium SAR86E TaxID=1208365 RepID=K6G7U1_9GAMM|nr:electron transport complex, RnfABCDGE type, B subunit [SAR86 cluster bacterium SAR86E]
MSNLIELINAELPQFQCGRCDTPGCRPYAEEIANGSPHNRCVPGGQVTLDRISDILNRDSLVLDHDYGPDLKSQVAHIVEEDCIGCTKCIDACPVDAISGAANLMHNVINDLCTGCELCIEPCPVDCIELIDIDEDKSLIARDSSSHFFDLKIELDLRKKKKSKMNKSIHENLNIGDSINQKLKNRNIDSATSLKKLQLEILESQKNEKYINSEDIEKLKKQL